MDKERKIIVFTFITMFFIMGLVSATIKYSGENIVRSYAGGDKLKGYINISFEDQNADSIFKSNFDEGGIRLLDLLYNNGFELINDFNCTTQNCNNVYVSEDETYSLIINSDEEKYIGVKLSKINAQIEDMSFKISSDVSPSCSPSFLIEILGNKSLEIQGNSYNDVACGESLRGCFDEGLGDYDSARIGTTPFCQRIELPSSPAFRIGAKVQNSSVKGKLTMSLFDKDWNLLGNCILPKHQNQTQELSCIVNFTNIGLKENYVCIQTDSSQTNYIIESESDGEICGITGTDSQEYDSDFNIFAQPLQYNPSNITIDAETLEKTSQENMIDSINRYIDQIYERNCTQGCVIPFKIYSSNPQTLHIYDVKMSYKAGTNGETTFENNKMYNVVEEKSKIDSAKLKINIEKADLKLPIVPSTNELQLFLDDKSILPKKIRLNITAGFSFDIAPKVVPFALETTFYVLSTQNITKVDWDFGDGKKEQTTIGLVNHAYTKEGNFNITVEVTNSKNAKSVNTFEINVGNVSESIMKLINQSQTNLNQLTRAINTFEPWVKERLLSLENITQYQEILNNVNKSINNTNKSDISRYAEELYSLKIPKNISYTNFGDLPLEVGFNMIDSKYLFDMNAQSCDSLEFSTCEKYDWVDKNKVTDYLIYWNSQNFGSSISYKTITRIYDKNAEPIFTYFNIEVKQKEEYENEAYMIIPYPLDSVYLKSNYSEIKVEGESDSFAIPIKGNMNIELLVLGEVSPTELGAFASPSLENIIKDMKIEPSCKDNPDLPECEKRSGLWLYIILILGVLVIYITLQEWYKRRYEGYLFPNRDDLYNVVNYIHNSRTSGMKDAQISKSLVDMKWKSEQMTYAFKKIDGKRTGMWEIPIFRLFEKRKVQREIEKRNQNKEQYNQINGAKGGSARFFNGPRQ